MKNYALAIMILLAMTVSVSVCLAEESFSAQSLLLSNQTSIGNHTIKIYTQKPIDTSFLLENIDANDDSASIQAKIDSKRKLLYPDEEIAVEISNDSVQTDRAPVTMVLVKSIYWWNNVNGQGKYWYATYDSNVAVIVVTVLSGSYELKYYNNPGWKLWNSYATTTHANSSFGSYRRRGFLGTGLSSYNKADIVMYFFK